MKSNKNKTGNYEVGYRRPPRHSQFKPGQSGNPKGRPKKEHSLEGSFIRALDSTVTVREGGKERTMTALDALTRRTVSDAIQGKSSAIKLVLAYVERLLPKSATPAALEPEKDHVASLRNKIEKIAERLDSPWTNDGKSAVDR